jgi:hypothetical protein
MHYLFSNNALVVYDNVVDAVNEGRAYSLQRWKDRGLEPKLSELATRPFEPYQSKQVS